MFFVLREPQTESLRSEAGESQFVDEGRVSAGISVESGKRSALEKGALDNMEVTLGEEFLRIILDGITEEEARMGRVQLTGVMQGGQWPGELRFVWGCSGPISEFNLASFFASVRQYEYLRVDQLQVEIDHPHYLSQSVRLPLSDAVELRGGTVVHELRVRLERPESWPKLSLAVRDVHTRTHLDQVELRIMPGSVSSTWGKPGASDTLLGDGLRSPIELMGGREANQPEVTVAGLALAPVASESPRLVELASRLPLDWGVIVSARAPGYAWGSITLDVSTGSDVEHEILLEPGAELSVRFSNVQLERYAALETIATLCVYRIREDGGDQYVRFERLDQTLMADGFRLEGLLPGEYAVAVELDGGTWAKRPVLARESFSLAASETRDVVLTLDNPPTPPSRATLGGVLSFPAFGREEAVRLQFYRETKPGSRKPDVELALTDMQPVGGSQPTWSFRAEDLPVGRYRIQVMPFLKVFMIDLPAGGREDLGLVLPELSEVLVETVDARSGEVVPLEYFYYRNEEVVPGQLQKDFAQAEVVKPGRFRFWTTPGEARVWPKFARGLGYSEVGEDFVLIPGLQSIRFELEPIYAMQFEFREGGVALPVGSNGMDVRQDIRAVDHEGHVTSQGFPKDMRIEVSAPGVYEINFDSVTGDRYYLIPPRLVNVQSGDAAKVIVELLRR